MWGQSQPNSPEWSQWVPKWFQLVCKWSQLVPECFQEVPKWSQEVFVFYVGITKLHCSGTPPSVMVSFSLEEQIWVQYSFWGIFLLYSYKFFIYFLRCVNISISLSNRFLSIYQHLFQIVFYDLILIHTDRCVTSVMAGSFFGNLNTSHTAVYFINIKS